MRCRVTFLLLCLASSVSAQMPKDKFFDANGVKIRYVEQGTGEPVLLIHGYTRSIESNWVETGIFQALAKDHRVIAFDLRGHGKSDKPHDPAAYGGETILDALRLLDHLGIRQAHFVGYSLGAAIVAKLATTHPERFLTATLGGHSGYRNWRPEYDENAKKTAAELESDVPFRSLVVAMTPADEPKRTEEEIRARSAALARRKRCQSTGRLPARWLTRVEFNGRGGGGDQGSDVGYDGKPGRWRSLHVAAAESAAVSQSRDHRGSNARW